MGAVAESGKLRVLVIDDNYDAASALALLVELWGYDVVVGYDGHEALEAVAKFAPHAILLDIGMPGLSGYQAARRIRLEEALHQVDRSLLIAITGYGSREDVEEAMRAGFDYHLLKPSDPIVLESLLQARAAQLVDGRVRQRSGGSAAASSSDGAASKGGTSQSDTPGTQQTQPFERSSTKNAGGGERKSICDAAIFAAFSSAGTASA
jgi:CheY-like chemotaxis protein